MTTPAHKDLAPTPGDRSAESGRGPLSAGEELHAAWTLLMQPDVPVEAARDHVARALAAIGRPPLASQQVAVVARWTDARATLERFARGEGPSADRGAIVGAIGIVLPATDEAPRPPLIRRFALTLATVGLLATAAIAYVRTRGIPGQGPWIGQYFPRDDLQGTPSVRYDAVIDFRWERVPPHPEIPPEKFSVRWDTCLHLSRPVADAAFQVTANDGARLIVDGAVIADRWRATKNPRTIAAEMALSAGVHHLRIEYFHKDGMPRVAFVASLDGQRPTDVPASMLRRPTLNADGIAHCPG